MKLIKITKNNVEHALDLEEKLAVHETKFDKKLKITKKRRESQKKSYMRGIKGRRFFGIMAEDNGKYVALLTGSIFFQYMWGESVGYLSDLYVVPGYRKRGIAKNMTKEFVTWLKKKKIRRVSLDVYEGSPAKKMYEKAGYKVLLTRMTKRI